MSKLKANKIIRAIDKAIKLNPSTIEIKETEKIKVDGAFEEVETIKTLIVLIYLEDSSNKIIVDSKIQGTAYKSNRYKMIANKDAELSITPNKSIEFDSIHGHIKIKAAYPIIIEEIICGYECDLERVE